MKKVFVKPEMKCHKLRGGKLLLGASGEDNPERCMPLEIQQCKPQYGCFTENQE